MVRGRLRIRYPDGEEVLRTGDLYSMPPGHTGVAEEDTELVEVSPPAEHQCFVNAANRSLAAMQSA